MVVFHLKIDIIKSITTYAGINMNEMIDAAPLERRKFAGGPVALGRYVVTSIIGIAAFCFMLWLSR